MEYKVEQMAEQIDEIKKSALKLKQLSGGIKAVDKNVDRILACVKMLEININDLLRL